MTITRFRSGVGPVQTLPIAISMAAALPIVATVTYTNAELLEDRHGPDVPEEQTQAPGPPAAGPAE